MIARWARRGRMRLLATILLIAAVLLAGCGLDVEAPDLFQVTRTGPGPKLTMLVNSSGTIACDGGKPKQLPDPLLLQARDLATSLNQDVKLHFARNAHSVFTYTVEVQNGTFTFPDTAASARKELAQLELFVVQAGNNPCGISS
ncbi:MAG TPA: hypothetical protein VMA77_12250 [Solirubrobacteraceae bacterium]|nr:hypothetical protein [Solirubrobacteraceae bacterium]